MDGIDSYQIKSRLDYFTLKDIAQEKLFIIADRWTKNLKEALVLVAVSFAFMIMPPIFCQGFPIADALLYVTAVVGFYIFIFAILMIRKTIVNLKKAIETYEFDLRRIQEKLTYSDIYIEIPESDKTEFDSIDKLIRISLKRLRKKNKKST